MAWDGYQQMRLAHERAGLREYCPSFSFYDTLGKTYVSGYWTSNTDRVYGVRIDVPPGYPDECPSTYIVSPSPLMDRTGTRTIESYGTSHAMHVWKSDRPGWPKICTYQPTRWSAAHSMLKVIRKAELWIFAYECHLQDGQPLQNFLLDA
ncbi:hypothetical protein ACQPZP_34835 [Spirillospora sp. CA-142024]|uniref:hypothetical protein n=1 Tax=unclassified Spirillospora TaxID=2642701 RepID=UPI003D8A6B9A